MTMRRARHAGPTSMPAVIFLFWLLACERPGERWHEESGYRWKELAIPKRGRPGFVVMPPSRTGIAFVNEVTEDQILENEHVLNGSGVAIGDVDGDGLPDIYLARLNGPNALYRNLGGWRFEDIADEAGVALADRFSTGCAFADVDGDGDLDLLVTSLGGPNSLFINDGRGFFRERIDAGLIGGLGSTTMALADTDGDGDLDLYVANYKLKSVRDIYPPQTIAFDQVVQRVGDSYVVKESFRQHYGLAVQKDRIMRFEYGEPDNLYLNDGDGRFVGVAWSGGTFLDEAGKVLAQAPRDWTLAARFHDIDGDGDPDLYVCNDFESPDLLWINDGKGRFRLSPPWSLRTTSQACMGVDFSDVDRDGDMDLFVVDMLDRDSGRRKRQTPPTAPEQLSLGDIDSRIQQPRNTLFMNRGDGTFAEVAHYAGVEASGWSWSTLFLDVDLDGYEDILIGTGHAYDFLDSDTQIRIQNSLIDSEWRHTRLLFPRLDLPNVAFRSRGDWTFEEVSQQWGFAPEWDVSHGMASGDLDGDGDLDVVINRLGRPALVLRNEATLPRLAVRLKGRPPNTQGVGAKIRVLGGPVAEQQKEVTLGGLYLSSAEPRYTFATGDAQTLTIIVDWRDGTRSSITEARPNRLYEIEQTGSSEKSHPPLPSRGPLFEDFSDRLRHRHVEDEYDDFFRQPLLLNRLSELGPGVSWYDVDGDGKEDLLITTGRGGKLGIYLNQGRTLKELPLPLRPAPLDLSTVLAAPDGKGGVILLLGQMNYEAKDLEEARRVPAVLGLSLTRSSSRMYPIVPGEESSTGPLALADYDGDGDLDLFVGGRVVPARYPAPASSRLLINDRGNFRLDSLNSQLLESIGLVSAAVFSDIDADGDPDLLLALEWGPIKLLVNQRGRFADHTSAYGLDRYVSRWNGITTGDFNEDGLLDVVATSWGRNSRLRADSIHPLFLYYGDFDRDGRADLVEAQYDPRIEALAPLRGFLRLGLGIPYVATRLGSFRAYADATLEDVLGREMNTAKVLKANTFDHTLFLSRPGGFEAVRLAREAQLAPAFYAGVADFDGDGHEDLFLAQNFFSTEIGTPRYDAGRGLLLKGDGRGHLIPIPGDISGIRIYGDQRGAAIADFNRDGRADLVVSQNAAGTKVYRNLNGRPGLRVKLAGGPTNPYAIGASIWLVYRGGRGPVREIKAGSGYWSQDSPIQVLGVREEPIQLHVRWPGGGESRVTLEPGAREITVRRP